MSRLKKLKYFTLVMLLISFIAVGSLSSCRDTKKEEKTDQQGEHPEAEEHPTEAGGAEEHPASDGDEHPAKEGEEEHPEGDK